MCSVKCGLLLLNRTVQSAHFCSPTSSFTVRLLFPPHALTCSSFVYSCPTQDLHAQQLGCSASVFVTSRAMTLFATKALLANRGCNYTGQNVWPLLLTSSTRRHFVERQTHYHISCTTCWTPLGLMFSHVSNHDKKAQDSCSWSNCRVRIKILPTPGSAIMETGK